ncbi:MAG: glycosyltransferase family 2 protein [Aquabacterium sp.]|uniref:glycosyltransferase family 2 protein n=1 Tax=Aquabacterium sp. TaxID=1872578 RepID=UPI0025C712A6|nr:glycosyltransferase family 2 protein [Aquabacterium sp.]MBI5924990.1 glycosyltransferase family 2 protein [Aquabacterium sp.]
MTTARLSVVIITKNEAQRLPTCLASVAFADELIVVDSGSTDGTVDLARQAGAKLIETKDWPGFGPQKQRGLNAATGEWVLCIDADEWLDAALTSAIKALVAQSPLPAEAPTIYEIDRLSAFCGQWMQAGSWSPDVGVRLFRRGDARFSDDLVHERLLFNGKTGRLPGRLLHNSITSVHDGLDKMNRYTTGRAEDQRRQGKRGSLGKAVGHGLWAFIRSYILRRGFMDGRIGFILAVLDAHNSYYRYLKLWLDGRVMPHDIPAPKSR